MNGGNDPDGEPSNGQQQEGRQQVRSKSFFTIYSCTDFLEKIFSWNLQINSRSNHHALEPIFPQPSQALVFSGQAPHHGDFLSASESAIQKRIALLCLEGQTDSSDWRTALAFTQKRHLEQIEGFINPVDSWRVKDRVRMGDFRLFFTLFSFSWWSFDFADENSECGLSFMLECRGGSAGCLQAESLLAFGMLVGYVHSFTIDCYAWLLDHADLAQ